jgi:hypothetical protein
MIRKLLALGIAIPVAAALALTGTAQAAAPTTAKVADCTFGDLNDDGSGDVVAGDPNATVNGKASAGDIVVRYGTTKEVGHGAQQVITQNQAVPGLSAEAGDNFGAVVEMGSVDGDDCADVIVSSPGEDVGSVKDAGAVQVIFGSPAGLGKGKPGLSLTTATAGLAGTVAAGDRFGTDLALTHELDPGDIQSLAIGIPDRDDGAVKDAGAIAKLDFAADGSISLAQLVNQSSPGVDGASETGDLFGAAIDFGYAFGVRPDGWSEQLLVGVPGENSSAGAIEIVDGTATAGTYNVLPITQNTPGFEGTSEAGDRFGASIDWAFVPETGEPRFAVGVPGEDIGSIKDAGAVLLVFGSLSSADDFMLSQNSAGITGTAEAHDGYGTSVLITEYRTDSGRTALIVGTPGEDVGKIKDAGTVSLLPVNEINGRQDVAITQNSPGVPGAAQAGEHFGQAIANSNGHDLLVGVPDDVGYSRGVVLQIPWSTVTGFGKPVTGLAWEPSVGSRFGAAIG